uniref:Uncharacterized protein n=1 Tax=Anopheles minimus TaxID=112268 RepID=A0A182VV07_9DIPT
MQLRIRPVTLPMVSQNGTPPMAMPMQVPHGHMMQQIVDENGTLRHVILSTQPPQPLRQGNVQHHLHPSAFRGLQNIAHVMICMFSPAFIAAERNGTA